MAIINLNYKPPRRDRKPPRRGRTRPQWFLQLFRNRGLEAGYRRTSEATAVSETPSSPTPQRISSRPPEATETPRQAPSLTGDVSFREVAQEVMALTAGEQIAPNWSCRGQHVQFQPSERLPLVEGRLLGRGGSADVSEVTCGGVILARKKVYCTRRLKLEDVSKEMDILRKLNHRHVVKLVGSYIQGKVLGLLLWPVATCDLGVFMEELDEFPDENSSGPWSSLGISTEEKNGSGKPTEALRYLRSLYGCLVSGLHYLHKSDIRHKDIKPRNILLTVDGPYIADFGQGKDLSDLTHSATDGIERGTYNYCAPEVAQYKPHGRSSDIYSLGCVFLEISTVLHGMTLKSFRDFRRTDDDASYHHNPEKVGSWIAELTMGTLSKAWMGSIGSLIGSMLAAKPSDRPTARQVVLALYSMGGIPSQFHRSCCQDKNPQNGDDDRHDLLAEHKGLQTKYSDCKTLCSEKLHEVQLLQEEISRLKTEVQAQQDSQRKLVSDHTDLLIPWMVVTLTPVDVGTKYKKLKGLYQDRLEQVEQLENANRRDEASPA